MESCILSLTCLLLLPGQQLPRMHDKLLSAFLMPPPAPYYLVSWPSPAPFRHIKLRSCAVTSVSKGFQVIRSAHLQAQAWELVLRVWSMAGTTRPELMVPSQVLRAGRQAPAQVGCSSCCVGTCLV